MHNPAPPITDHLPISLRAYVPPIAATNDFWRSGAKGNPPQGSSEWTLIFDCETTIDASQKLRFGTYQVRDGGELWQAGLFYDPANVSQCELSLLQLSAANEGMELLTRDEFVDQIFFGIGYGYRAAIVGFNLPFDLSRIAIRQGSAKGRMRGGFSFALSHDKRPPHVQVKHHSSKAAFIQFTAPFKGRTNRSLQKRNRKEPVQRGHFLDVKTLAFALFAKPFSLASLCDMLDVASSKQEFDGFAGPISDDMIAYAVRDTQATWECYEKLIAKYRALGLRQTLPEKIYSEASVGKGYLKEMAIRPWQQCQPDFSPAMIGTIMASYFGGRSEIKIRRQPCQVMLCDFLSMYPTVCTLLDLWPMVIAGGIDTHDATDEARELLESTTLEMLQSKAIWKRLAILVRIKPDADIFPVRAHYADAQQATIGLNGLSADRPLWFTLADCIAAKLIGGKCPEIVEAIGFSPKRKQRGLRSININGEADYAIDPATDDFYKRLIELRHATKSAMDGASELECERLDVAQHNLKILANSTSYGIFVEINVSEAKAKTIARVHNGDDVSYDLCPSKIEAPGQHFHPLLATLITGAARLMLAITERLALDKGLEWAFCDTDSMALAKPDGMVQDEFAAKVQAIIDWFGELNPYAFGGSILKSEAVNFALGDSGTLAPLYCFAISAKRYALYNLDGNGDPILRKASAHGLGHLRAPYDASNPAIGIAPPQDSLANIGVELWQHDLWIKIIEAAYSDHPERVDLSYHPALQLPAINRYAATSPAILRWFKHHNVGRDYADQVKPFGFLTALSMKAIAATETTLDGPQRRKPNAGPIQPVAAFTTDPEIAAATAFDRNSGAPVPADKLRTYAQCLAQYHLHPENKFLNGDYLDSGTTQRRHVQMSHVANIGKEANDWERQVILGYDRHAQPIYGYGPDDVAAMQRELQRLCSIFSKSEMAQLGDLTIDRIDRFLSASCASELALQTAPDIQSLICEVQRLERKAEKEINDLKRRCDEDGLRQTARQLGVDPSNLRRRLASRG